MSKQKKSPLVSILKTILFLLGTLVFLWGLGLALFTLTVTTINPSDNQSADIGIVLTGGAYRVDQGLDLLSQERINHLFVSGVDDRVSVQKLVELWGGDTKVTCCVTLDYNAENTTQNAHEAQKWLATTEAKSVLIITTAPHVPRAWLEFSSRLTDYEIKSYPVPVNAENGASFKALFILNEYNKTLLTFLNLKLFQS